MKEDQIAIKVDFEKALSPEGIKVKVNLHASQYIFGAGTGDPFSREYTLDDRNCLNASRKAGTSEEAEAVAREACDRVRNRVQEFREFKLPADWMEAI